jgi:hypothetical protein
MYVGMHARQPPDAPARIMAGSAEVTTSRDGDDGSNRLAELYRRVRRDRSWPADAAIRREETRT